VPTVRVTRRVHFSAAHRLHNPAMSDEENARVFGLCNLPNWHGHNYELDVTVEGEPDPATGYLVDLAVLRDVAGEEIDGVIPSTENLVVALWEQIAPRIPRGRLARLVLWETPRNYAEYTGE